MFVISVIFDDYNYDDDDCNSDDSIKHFNKKKYLFHIFVSILTQFFKCVH